MLVCYGASGLQCAMLQNLLDLQKLVLLAEYCVLQPVSPGRRRIVVQCHMLDRIPGMQQEAAFSNTVTNFNSAEIIVK